MRPSLKILYEDDHLVVVEKPEGMLSVSTSRGRDEVTAHSLLNEYVNAFRKHRGYNARAYIVHRLDRETSGIMVFAKSEEVKHLLQENWDQAVTKRGYVAVVNCSRGMAPGAKVQWTADEDGSRGKITSWLKENSAYIVYSSARDNGGQLAITNFNIKEYNPQCKKALIELELETGRKNQIRVHMQEMGTPIYGDRKYFGENQALLAENKKARRLYLHAYALNFIHPITGKEMKFSTGIPRGFITEISATAGNQSGATAGNQSERAVKTSQKRRPGNKPQRRGIK